MYTGTDGQAYKQIIIIKLILRLARACLNLIIGETDWITRVIYIKIINSLLNTDGRITDLFITTFFA